MNCNPSMLGGRDDAPRRPFGATRRPGARNLFRFNARRSKRAKLPETIRYPTPFSPFAPVEPHRFGFIPFQREIFQVPAKLGCPGGTPENSPAFQRREKRPEVLSP